MKILHIPNAYDPVMGGAEIICKRVSEQLVVWGHSIRVVTTDVGAVQAYYQFDVSQVHSKAAVINGVLVERLPYCDRWYKVGGWLHRTSILKPWGKKIAFRVMSLLRKRLNRKVLKEIDRYTPDVVMTMPHLVINVLAVLEAKRKRDFPLVMVPMLHEYDPNWDIASMTAALKYADSVVAMTDYEIERLVETYEVPRKKIFLGSVGAEVSVSVKNWSTRLRRVVFLGRKARSKGIDQLIDAMRLVWDEIPDVELCIAGVRLPETAEIDAKIAALPEHDRQRIRDIPVVVGEDKAAFLQSAYCLVLPSKTESFGMVILDAWANQTPVVAWDLPLFRSIVDNGVDGLLAEPSAGTISLAKAILALLQNPSDAQRMGYAGYKKVKQDYSWEKVAFGYFQAYGHAIQVAKFR